MSMKPEDRRDSKYEVAWTSLGMSRQTFNIRLDSSLLSDLISCSSNLFCTEGHKNEVPKVPPRHTAGSFAHS